jgi:branched-chain amino acid transport system permease protein
VHLLLEQLLNGLQFGVMLFLLAAGLTLVFGIMNMVNLAHGAFYMLGAYAGAIAYAATGSFLLGLLAGIGMGIAVSIAIELTAIRKLYRRNHLDQVLGTFGLILFFNEMIRVTWGPEPIHAAIPAFLDGQIEIAGGLLYPTFRLAIIAVGLLVALGLSLLINHTRVGMLIRAGASNREMAQALGVNARLLFTAIFGLGGALAGLAGIMAGPVYAVQPGMGESILILCFVVIVIGGIGSIRGAFVAAILIGVVDTLGRAFLRNLLVLWLPPDIADSAGPGLASMLMYVVMALVLVFRPEGLFSPQRS